MLKKTICLFAISLLSGATVLSHSSDNLDTSKNSTTSYKKPQTSLIKTGISGYGIGLATGLIPILIPATIMSLAGASNFPNKKEAAVFVNSIKAGFLTGLGVWCSAIFYWLQYMKN